MIAKIAEVIYLITILCGIFSEGFVTSTLIVEGDAAATATNILQNQSLYKASNALTLIEMVCQLVTVVLIYMLLKPAGPKTATVAVYVGVAGAVIKTISNLFYIAPIYLLTDASYLEGFTTEQIQSLSLFLLDLNTHGEAIALVFLGIFTLLSGYLIIKSNFLPKALGYITLLGGTGWLSFFYPTLGFILFPFVALLGLLGVIALIFWFLRFGVNEEQWRLQSQKNGLTSKC